MEPTTLCEQSLRRSLDELRVRNGRGVLLDALVGVLVVEARNLGEAHRVANELQSVADELRASVRTSTKRSWVRRPPPAA